MPQTPFIKEKGFHQSSFSQHWQNFRKKIGISGTNANVENFQLILDSKDNIYSMKVDIIDYSEDKYKIYHYDHCFSCENYDKKSFTSKKNVDEWFPYSRTISANDFFAKLDILKKEHFLTPGNHKYIMIC
jgi:hypothetical protein